jgi:hemoglobin
MTGLGAPSPFDSENTPYDAIGGADRVRDLVDTFYDRMDSAPEYAGIRSLHPDDLATSREKLYMFLSGWLGGPGLYVERFGHPRLRGRHMPFPIGEAERDQWLACMGEALDASGVTGELRTFLDARFAHVADFMRNQSPSGTP